MSAGQFFDAGFNVQGVGPFETFEVIVNGWTVPHLDARLSVDREVVHICLDRRLEFDCPADKAAGFLSFLADVIAVSKGWACHPRSVEWEPHGWSNGGPTKMLPWTRLSALRVRPREAPNAE